MLSCDRVKTKQHLYIYTLHGVGLKNEYLILVVSIFVKKHQKSAFLSDK